MAEGFRRHIIHAKAGFGGVVALLEGGNRVRRPLASWLKRPHSQGREGVRREAAF